MNTSVAIQMIADERARQRDKWGDAHDRTHNDAEWCMLIAIYFGKANDAMLNGGDPHLVLRRITQLGALCAAAIESLSNQHGYNQ